MSIKKPVVVNNDTHSELLTADTLDAASIAIDNDSMLSVDDGKLTTIITTNNTPTLSLGGAGSQLTPLTGSVIISPATGNALTATPNGLFASGNVGVLTDNTSSIQLTGNGTSGSHLGAAVRISADAGNVLLAKTDGLYVNASGGSIQAFMSEATTTTITPAWNPAQGVMEVIECGVSGQVQCDLAGMTALTTATGYYKLRLVLTATSQSTIKFINSPTASLATPLGLLTSSTTPTDEEYGIDYDKNLVVDVEYGFGHAPIISIVSANYERVITGVFNEKSFTYTGDDVSMRLFDDTIIPMYSGKEPTLHLQIYLIAPNNKPFDLAFLYGSGGGIAGEMISHIFNPNIMIYGSAYNDNLTAGALSAPTQIKYKAGYIGRVCVLNLANNILNQYVSNGDTVHVDSRYTIIY